MAWYLFPQLDRVRQQIVQPRELDVRQVLHPARLRVDLAQPAATARCCAGVSKEIACMPGFIVSGLGGRALELLRLAPAWCRLRMRHPPRARDPTFSPGHGYSLSTAGPL